MTMNLKNCTAADTVALIEASRPRTYLFDICERCGHVIKKDSHENK